MATNTETQPEINISAKISHQLWKRLRDSAEDKRISLREITVQALEQWLEREG